MAGSVSPAPVQSSVPKWCRQALVRGMAPARENRFESMEALLAALAVEPRSRRRGTAIAAAVVAAVLVAVGGYALMFDRPAVAAGPTCDGGMEQLAGVWDEPRKRQLGEAFERSVARGADVTWKSFSRIVDERARAWAAMHNETCAATHKRGVQSPEILDLRMECLARKRQEMKALADVYAETPDAKTLDRAVAAADKLSLVNRCADVTSLRAVVPPPEDPAVRSRVDSLRQRLNHARALEEAGRYEQGREYMESLKQEVDAIGYAPLAAEAGIALGTHLSLAGKAEDAEKVLFDAAKQAVLGRDWTLEAEAWLAALANYKASRRMQELASTGSIAELAVERANGDDAMRVRLATQMIWVKQGAGKVDEVPREFDRAEQLAKKSFRANSLGYAKVLRELGNYSLTLGRQHDALSYSERALDIMQATLRPDHPDIANMIFMIGIANGNLGRIKRGTRWLSVPLSFLSRSSAPNTQRR